MIFLFPFFQALLRREPLKLVDGGQSQRTFVYIKDAIEAVNLMIVLSNQLLLSVFTLPSPTLFIAELCDLSCRKIQTGPMVRFLMLAILKMKLQLGSLLR
uniref:Bifunctional polymyxin resistance protein ArnA n=1 Tax=Rhizophora mucronata TaxID=61149 RepID=A0A2P2LF72_RHIMU